MNGGTRKLEAALLRDAGRRQLTLAFLFSCSVIACSSSSEQGPSSSALTEYSGGSSSTLDEPDDGQGLGGSASGGASTHSGDASGGTPSIEEPGTGGSVEEPGTGGSVSDELSIFVGGVSGIDGLTVPENTDTFRAKGGGLYLHHSGWAPLDSATKSEILSVFEGQPVVVELGYKNNDFTSWQHAYKVHYHDRGIRPRFITLNAFSSDRQPDVDEFVKSVEAYRALGVSEDTSILATFEYQNFPGQIPLLAQNHVSVRKDFQEIIEFSGGLVLDTPSIVFFRREQAYRNWVIDAITWTRHAGHEVAIIFSPNNAKTEYDENTLAYLEYLSEHDALPDLYAVENYSTDNPATYPNIVGSEDTPHHQVGCARMIQDTVRSL